MVSTEVATKRKSPTRLFLFRTIHTAYNETTTKGTGCNDTHTWLDLLRPELSYEEQVKTFGHKQELTEEDLDIIIEKAEQIKKAAGIAKMYRYGK